MQLYVHFGENIKNFPEIVESWKMRKRIKS